MNFDFLQFFRCFMLLGVISKRVLFPKESCFLQVAMSQTSIKSFFRPLTNGNSGNSNSPLKKNINDAIEEETKNVPKVQKKRKRIMILESDSDDDLKLSGNKRPLLESVEKNSSLLNSGLGSDDEAMNMKQSSPKAKKKKLNESSSAASKKKMSSDKDSDESDAVENVISKKDSNSEKSSSTKNVKPNEKDSRTDTRSDKKKKKTKTKTKDDIKSPKIKNKEKDGADEATENAIIKNKSKKLEEKKSKKELEMKINAKHRENNKSGEDSTGDIQEKAIVEDKTKPITEKNSPKIKKMTTKMSNKSAEIINYDPASESYHPIDDAIWKHGERVPYLALAKTLMRIEETSGRLKMVDILSNYFRSVLALSDSDLLPSVYLCLNKLAPAYEGLELGIAETYLMKAIAQCTGRTLAQIKADASSCGDLGVVAEQSRSNQRIMFRPAALTVQSVFTQFNDIASISGQNSISRKIDKIQALFVACRDCEARYVIRSLAGKLRIGLAEQSVLQALATACVYTPPRQEYPPKVLNASKSISKEELKKKIDDEALVLKTTYCECPNYNLIIPVLLKSGIKSLPEHCKVSPGLPVKPMLAQPTKGAQEVLQRFEGMKFTCEWKYDGERAQIHLLDDGKIKIYSRNQEDTTSKYPDIASGIKEAFGPDIKNCILDTESVAWDRENKQILPFQILSTRKRKDASENEIKVQVCVYMFDLLFLNGRSLVRESLSERRKLLKEYFREVNEKFVFVTSLDTNTMEQVQEFLEDSIKGNCEGLMVKTLEEDATYEIAKRSRNWLKLKKDYLDGVGDTLDLVVIGGYTGRGKRTGTYGGFLLASYDTDTEEYQTICKIGTGFSDEDLATHASFFKEHVIPSAKSYYRHDSSQQPDYWFDAVQVWEVKCADLSLSPVYCAGMGLVDSEKGISLRFPRFVRIRTDKKAEEATSSQQIANMYKNQDQIKNQANSKTKVKEEDFY